MYRLTFHSAAVKSESFAITCNPGESLYDAAARQLLKVPVACRNGVCCICKAQLVLGQVRTGAQQRNQVRVSQNEALCENQSEIEKCSPYEVMMCQVWPESDCEFEVESLLRPGELPLKNIKCQVDAVELIQGHVYQVQLRLPAGKLPEFYAGQYLSINLPDREEPCFYSIASRPGIREIRLHIQADPHLQSAVDVIEYLQKCLTDKACVLLELPMGKACIAKPPEQELILVAAGTGFAQMTSIIEYMEASGFSMPISLYWGVRREEDMYMRERAEAWAREHEKFTFHPLIAELDNIEDNAHHNQLSDAVLADFSDLSNALVFVSGSPKLVFSAMDAFVDAGLKSDQFFSDVLEYATR